MNDKIKSSLLKTPPYKFYMLDFNTEQFFSIKYYQKRKDVDSFEKKQFLKKIFLDIEVFTDFENKFPEPKEAKKKINAVSLITDKGKESHTFFLKIDDIKDINKKDFEKDIKTLIEKEYNYIFDKVNIHIFEDEKDLLISLFNFIHKYDPAAILGFNAKLFDFPYLFKRVENLFGKILAPKIVSKFNNYSLEENNVSVLDYQLVDILELYKPGEGFGFGQSLEKYNLDTVAEVELGIKKVEYENMSLDELYVKNPLRFIYYNIVDTLLIYLLDKKLDHLSLFNSQRRLTFSPFSRAYHGRSVMGETIQTFKLIEENKLPRSFLVKEKIATFKYGEKEFQKHSLSLKYYGAYVRDPGKARVIKGLIVDLDQTSMYPSLDIQYNISYETFICRVYGSFIDSFMKYLKDLMDSKDKKLLEALKKAFEKYITEFVKNKLKPSNMSETINYNVKFVNLIFDTIYKFATEKNYTFDDLINVRNYYLTKTKVAVLLEILSLVHPKSHEYCDVVYDYIFMDEKEFDEKYKDKVIWVYEKPTDSDFKIKPYDISSLKENILKKYILTPAGSLFLKHSEKLGILNDICMTFMKLRKETKKKRDSFSPDSFEYRYFDNVQLSYKIILNAISYGVQGLTTYRFNEIGITRAITISGRLLIKSAQMIAQKVIDSFNKNLY